MKKKHFQPQPKWKKITAAIGIAILAVIILTVANTGPTGYPVINQKISLTLEIMSLDVSIDGGPAPKPQLKVLKIFGGSWPADILTLANGFSGSTLYLVIENRTPNGGRYVGKILYYNSTARRYESFAISRDETVDWRGAPQINYTNIANFTGPRSGQQIMFNGKNILIFGNYGANATIQIEDDYNYASGEGGNWRIDFNNTNFSPYVTPRKIYYRYYQSTTGKHFEVPSGESLYWRSSIPSFLSQVAPRFTSPSGAQLYELTATKIRIVKQRNITFNWTCIDNDTANDRYVAGSALIGSSGVSDACYFNWNPGNAARVTETRCDSNELPMRITTNIPYCPNEACNAAQTACAPADTIFTCIDSDGGNTPNTAGFARLNATTAISTYPRKDACVGRYVNTSFGYTGIREYYCSSNGIRIENTTIACPNGCGETLMTIDSAQYWVARCRP